MSTSESLKKFFAAGRPLVEQAFDIAEEIAALRDAATAQGLDWSAIKALLKAQILDERGDTDKHVKKLVEKAEFACAYADMLGLANMNEISIATAPEGAATSFVSAFRFPVSEGIDPFTGEIITGTTPALQSPAGDGGPLTNVETGDAGRAGAAQADVHRTVKSSDPADIIEPPGNNVVLAQGCGASGAHVPQPDPEPLAVRKPVPVQAASAISAPSSEGDACLTAACADAAAYSNTAASSPAAAASGEAGRSTLASPHPDLPDFLRRGKQRAA